MLRVACGLFVLRVLWAMFILPETLRSTKRAKRATLNLENPIRAMAILFRTQMFVCLTAIIALTAFVTNGLFHIQLFYMNVRCRVVRQWPMGLLAASQAWTD